MSDLGIAYGDPGVGPPLNLPTLSSPPRQRIRIDAPKPVAAKAPAVSNANAPLRAEDFPDYDHAEAMKAQQAYPEEKPLRAEDFPDYNHEEAMKPPPQVGQTEAALMGLRSGLTQGTYPALKGTLMSGGVGAPYLDYMPPGEAEKARAEQEREYSRTASEQRRYEQATSEQNPISYGVPELVGGILPGILTGGAGAAAEVPFWTRMGRAALTGIGYGAMGGAGTAIGQGETPGVAAQRAAIGAGIGGVGGPLLGTAVPEGGVAAGRRIGQLVRGIRDPAAEAENQVIGAIAQHQAAHGPSLTSGMMEEADKAGTPIRLMDVGGQQTLSLGRAAANRSNAAWQTLNDFVRRRFDTQSQRIGRYIKDFAGGDIDMAAMDEAARKANAPAYRAAYAVGDRPIWSPELERISSSPAVRDAMRGAERNWGDWQVGAGYGASNPPVRITPDGRILHSATGLPTYPNLQYWDFVQRDLAGKASEAYRKGNLTDAKRYGDLVDPLKAELDNLVPQFAEARTGAAKFFGARNAVEAGKKFVTDKTDPKLVGKFKDEERDLFSQSFANELANKVMGLGNRADVVNQAFLTNPNAKTKIVAALGPKRATQLETLLRVEDLVHQADKVLGNSQTTRQLASLASHSSGAGAVAAYEYLKEGDWNPRDVILGALAIGQLQQRAGARIHGIDEAVNRRIADLLISEDPRVYAAGIRAVVRNPAILNALRYGETVISKAFGNIAGRHPEPIVGTAMALPHLIPGGGSHETPEQRLHSEDQDMAEEKRQ